jgi:hypothetical protein
LTDSNCFMESIGVQGAVKVVTMRAISDRCAYAVDVPPMNGREALSLPRGWLVTNLGRWVRFLRNYLSVSVSFRSFCFQHFAFFVVL